MRVRALTPPPLARLPLSRARERGVGGEGMVVSQLPATGYCRGV